MMKTFNIYRHPVHGVKLVKVGFSWPAFFGSILWMLSKKLWKQAAFCFFINILINNLENFAEGYCDAESLMGVYSFTFMTSLALWLVPAFHGNKWQEANLLKRGYLMGGPIGGGSGDAVVQGAKLS